MAQQRPWEQGKLPTLIQTCPGIRSLWRGVHGASWLKEEGGRMLEGEDGHRGTRRPGNESSSYPEVYCALVALPSGSQAPWLQRQTLIQPPC